MHLQELLEGIFRHEENGSKPSATMAATREGRDRRALRKVLGSLILLYSTLPLKSFQKFLEATDQCKAESILSHLHSILDVPTDYVRAIRLHHPSLRDFLLSKDRCGGSELWVDEEKTHSALATACLRIMSQALRVNLCNQGSPGMLVQDVAYDSVQCCLSPELQYACSYWIPHSKGSNQRLLDDGDVHRFLREHVLHWIEAMSWMGKMSEAIEAMASLESVTKMSKPHDSNYDSYQRSCGS